MAETVLEIVAAHRAGTATPAETVARSYARIRAHNDPAVFISLRDEADAVAEAKALEAKGDTSLPLYGVPVAVKDNIDVAGLPTTAACPAFSFNPTHDSTAVARLRAAGAIVIGKTNLDQFATGLVGVRSPYGVPRNSFDADLIPGGSVVRLGGGGGRRSGAAGARHRHRRLRPRAGRLQQYCRPQAQPRPDLDAWPGAGLPHARLHFGVRADRR